MTATQSRPLISLVLPAYNCETFLSASLERAVSFFEDHGWPFEVICVNDGSTDGTGRIAPPDGRVRLIHHKVNRGKGFAIRTGMLAASGAVCVFTDADLPYDLDRIALAAYYLLVKDYHLVIGDRTLRESVYREVVSTSRRLASSVFSFIAGRFITGGIYDTQCGFKAFRGDVAGLLFPRLKIDRFACDVEMIYACLANNLDIKRIPVRLIENQPSTVRLVRDSLRTLTDVLTMRLLRWRGGYRLDESVRNRIVDLPVALADLQKRLENAAGGATGAKSVGAAGDKPSKSELASKSNPPG